MEEETDKLTSTPNFLIFATKWCKPLIFLTWTISKSEILIIYDTIF